MPSRRAPLVLLLVGEDLDHFEVVSSLVDLRLRARLTWLREDDAARMEWVRTWAARADERRWHKRHEVIDDWQIRWPNARVHARGEGEEYLLIRKLLVALAALHPTVDVLFLAHDVDRRAARALGHRSAVRDAGSARPVVLVLPEPEIEAWPIALAHGDPGVCEKARAYVPKIGFDPIASPELLTSRVNGGPRDAKAVRTALLGDRSVGDIIATFGADTLPPSSTKCGLAAFLHDLDRSLETVFESGELDPA